MEHKIIFIGLFLVLLLGFSFAFISNQNNNPNVIEFKNSNWNYIKGYGFVDDKALDFIKQQEFTERSREYFLGEIK